MIAVDKKVSGELYAEAFDTIMEKNRFFNLQFMLEDEMLILERDAKNNVLPFSKNGVFEADETSGYDKMVLRYGQIDPDTNQINGIGRKIRIDYYSEDGIEGYKESYSYIEEGQFVDDELQGFGRRVYFWNSEWDNRIGWGKDNKERGRDANNFRLEGLGRRYDADNHDWEEGTFGHFEDDDREEYYDDLEEDKKTMMDDGSFTKWLYTMEQVENLRGGDEGKESEIMTESGIDNKSVKDEEE